MPRYRSVQRRVRGYRDNKIWLPVRINALTAKTPEPTDSPDNRSWLIATANIPGAETDHVIERIRGQLQVSTLGTTALVPGLLTGIILPDAIFDTNALGSEVTDVVPDITDTNASQDFPMVMDACIPTGRGLSTPSTGINLPVDIKSKRRVRKGDNFHIIFRALDSLIKDSSSPGNAQWKFVGALRFLLRLAS